MASWQCLGNLGLGSGGLGPVVPFAVRPQPKASCYPREVCHGDPQSVFCEESAADIIRQQCLICDQKSPDKGFIFSTTVRKAIARFLTL